MEKHPPSVRDVPHASQDIISIRSYNTSASTVCVWSVPVVPVIRTMYYSLSNQPPSKSFIASSGIVPVPIHPSRRSSLIHYYRLTRVNARNNGLLCCYCLVLVDVKAFFSQKKEESTDILSSCICVLWLFNSYSFIIPSNLEASHPGIIILSLGLLTNIIPLTHERTNECCYEVLISSSTVSLTDILRNETKIAN